MITIELTEKQIEHLIEQARQYGGFGLIVETGDGQMASVVLRTNHRRDRRKTNASENAQTP